jgi:hypothetical protein
MYSLPMNVRQATNTAPAPRMLPMESLAFHLQNGNAIASPITVGTTAATTIEDQGITSVMSYPKLSSSVAAALNSFGTASIHAS